MKNIGNIARKIKKYEEKLNECNLISDYEICSKKLDYYKNKIHIQKGGNMKTDLQIYENILDIFKRIDELDKLDNQTILLKGPLLKEVDQTFNELSEDGKKKYSRIIGESLKLFKN